MFSLGEKKLRVEISLRAAGCCSFYYWFAFNFFWKYSYSEHCFDVAQRRWKLYVGNENVVLTLYNVVCVSVEKENVVSTLLNIVNFNIDV